MRPTAPRTALGAVTVCHGSLDLHGRWGRNFCIVGATGDAKGKGCWIGQLGGASGPCPGTGCPPHKGWQGRGRSGGASPSPPPGGGGSCNDPGCDPKTDDSGWRTVTVPHDFVVEHNFSEHMTGPKPTQHGYLPFGIAWCESACPFLPPCVCAVLLTLHREYFRPQALHAACLPR